MARGRYHNFFFYNFLFPSSLLATGGDTLYEQCAEEGFLCAGEPSRCVRHLADWPWEIIDLWTDTRRDVWIECKRTTISKATDRSRRLSIEVPHRLSYPRTDKTRNHCHEPCREKCGRERHTTGEIVIRVWQPRVTSREWQMKVDASERNGEYCFVSLD